MADYVSPLAGNRPKRKPRTGYALAVVVAGLLLAFCAILPWAGIEARSDLIGTGVTKNVRGIDDPFGVYVLICGLLAVACGVGGAVTRKPLAALALIPGASRRLCW